MCARGRRWLHSTLRHCAPPRSRRRPRVKAAESQEAAAQTQSALAASTLARYKQLQAEKSVSPQEMDEVTRRAEAAAAGVDAVRAQRDAAKAQESGARAMLGYTRLNAPFAGVVTARMADPGTMAAPGVPLLQIESAGPLQLQAAVDESAIGSVRKGMKISVTIDGAPDGPAHRHCCRDRPRRRSGKPQLYGQDRSCSSRATARRHVRQRADCDRHASGDSRSALGGGPARFAFLCVCSRRKQNCATAFDHAGRGAGRVWLKCCPEFLPTKSWLIFPATATWRARESRPNDEPGTHAS